MDLWEDGNILGFPFPVQKFFPWLAAIPPFTTPPITPAPMALKTYPFQPIWGSPKAWEFPTLRMELDTTPENALSTNPPKKPAPTIGAATNPAAAPNPPGCRTYSECRDGITKIIYLSVNGFPAKVGRSSNYHGDTNDKEWVLSVFIHVGKRIIHAVGISVKSLRKIRNLHIWVGREETSEYGVVKPGVHVDKSEYVQIFMTAEPT